VTGVAVFARDITERKQRENELIRTNFELDSFVYRSSHDMRAPLRSILGLVNLIRMEEDPDKAPAPAAPDRKERQQARHVHPGPDELFAQQPAVGSAPSR
jgi:light-regulated signal transduction histidine kinase (bacteriophytochrome)